MHPRVGIAQGAVVGRLAPPVVGVDASGCVFVESLDGLGQAGGVDAAQGGEVVERPGLFEHPALEQLIREPTGAGPLVRVALPVAVVEDQPAGNRPARLVAGVHLLAHFHVRVRLVHEPLSGGVDIDRPGALPGLVEGGLAEPTRPRRRQPPGLVHQVRLGADPHRRLERLAGVARIGDRPPGSVGLVAAELLAHLGVVGEAAGGQQHALAGPDQERGPVPHGADPDDAAILDDQLLDGRIVQIGIPRSRAIRNICPISEAPFVSSACRRSRAV